MDLLSIATYAVQPTVHSTTTYIMTIDLCKNIILCTHIKANLEIIQLYLEDAAKNKQPAWEQTTNQI